MDNKSTIMFGGEKRHTKFDALLRPKNPILVLTQKYENELEDLKIGACLNIKRLLDGRNVQLDTPIEFKDISGICTIKHIKASGHVCYEQVGKSQYGIVICVLKRLPAIVLAKIEDTINDGQFTLSPLNVDAIQPSVFGGNRWVTQKLYSL